MAFPLSTTIPTPLELTQLDEANRLLITSATTTTGSRFRSQAPEESLQKLCTILESPYILAVLCHHPAFLHIANHYPNIFKPALLPHKERLEKEIAAGELSDIANAWLRLTGNKPFYYNIPSLLPLIPLSRELDYTDLPLFGVVAEDLDRSAIQRFNGCNLFPSLRNLLLHYTPLASAKEFSARLWANYRHTIDNPSGAKSLAGNLHFSHEAAEYLLHMLSIELVKLTSSGSDNFPAPLRDALDQHVHLSESERSTVKRIMLHVPGGRSISFFTQTKTYIDDNELFAHFLASRSDLPLGSGSTLVNTMSPILLAERLPRFSRLLTLRSMSLAFRRVTKEMAAPYPRQHWGPLLKHPDKEVRLQALAFLHSLDADDTPEISVPESS